MRKLSFILGAFVFVAMTGCTDSVTSVDSMSDSDLSAAESSVLSKVGFGYIWADGELFGTVGTPTSLPEDQGPFDKLFQAAPGSFKDGVGAISESKPGDQDWNGGRWEIYKLKDGVMTDYSNADSVDDLNLSDFEPRGIYLECPLTPQRGRGHE